jgi:hypothetical protein
MSRLEDIVNHRRALVAAAELQRRELAFDVAGLRQSLRFADVGMRAYRVARSNSFLITLGLLGVAALGPRRLVRLGYSTGLLAVGLRRLMATVRSLR